MAPRGCAICAAQANAAVPNATAGACSHPLTAEEPQRAADAECHENAARSRAGASADAAYRTTAADRIEMKTNAMLATLTAAAWTIAAAGEKMACVSVPAVMTNGGRIERTSAPDRGTRLDMKSRAT